MADFNPLMSHHRHLRTSLVTVQENREVAENTRRLRFLVADTDFLSLVEPGQFIMLRLPNSESPLLGRPFAVYSVDFERGEMEIIYLVVGRMTKRLAQITPETPLEMWGPLGNGWGIIEKSGEKDSALSAESSLPFRHLIMAAGGIGQTPFYMLAQKYLSYPNPPKMTLLYGTRNRARLTDLEDFQKLGINICVATEDGSVGHRGFVTEKIEETIRESNISAADSTIIACGPKPMLAAVFAEAKKGDVRCFTSLESPMSCGLGLCFGCVVDYLDDQGEWDYRRTCVDGPVFDAYRLRW